MLVKEYPTRRHIDQRWRIAFENSAIGIAMADFTGRFFAANNAFLDMLGYTDSELYQLTFIDVTYKEDLERNLRLLNELMEGKRKHFEIEKRYCRKDSSLVWVRANVALVPGMGAGTAPFWFAIVEDITGWKQAEKELLTLKDELSAELRAMTRLHEFSTHLLTITESKTLLEEVLDATIALQDANFGNIQLYKPETRALEVIAQRGFQPGSLKHFRPVHDETAYARAIKFRERVVIEDVETDPEFAPYRCIAAMGGFRAVQSTPLFSRSGEVLGVLSTHFREPHRPSPRDLRFTDLYATYAANIIEREQLEGTRRQVEEELEKAQVEVERVSRLTTMGELAATIAHEVNQPLTAITNNANACLRLLADHRLAPEVLHRALEEIVGEGTRASAVVAQIRAFIRKAPAERTELDVNSVIQEALALTCRVFDANRVLLERQFTESLPTVLADRVQLQQVLLNLIINGIEAMSVVTNRPRLLQVQSELDQSGNVLVGVRDSGTGLAVEADRVFDPFFSTKANGMGMGLSISRSLIESHGGRLWSTPNSPYGAVFYFTLPAASRRVS